MKIFFDTEFIESEKGIELVSIGMITEDGRTLYIENKDFDASLADEWVKENVLKKLKYWGNDLKNKNKIIKSKDKIKSLRAFISSKQISRYILDFIGNEKAEFYAYYCSYDWVVFCRIFGRMIDLPKNFPMFCIDIKQMMEERGLTKEWKQKVCPDPKGEHNALVDAEWNLKLYNIIKKLDK